jgi:hypothetical protein
MAAQMTDREPRSLLRPDAPEWTALNREKRALVALPPGTPVEELLRQGQQLSEQAALLVEAVERADERGGSAS